MKSALLIPDVHRPFHSQKCWDLIIKVAIDRKYDEIILLGDYLDFLNLSMHGPRDPRVQQNLLTEIVSGNFGLDQLDQLFPDTKKIFIEGNHETRLERYILNNAPALFGVTEIRRCLEMDRRKNWLWVPYGPNQHYKILGTRACARHEPLKSTPALTVREAGASLIYGHIHKRESASHTTLMGTKNFAACPGWIGDPNARSAAYIKGIQNWQWGFMEVFADKDGIWPFQYSISDNYRTVVDGKEYKA